MFTVCSSIFQPNADLNKVGIGTQFSHSSFGHVQVLRSSHLSATEWNNWSMLDIYVIYIHVHTHAHKTHTHIYINKCIYIYTRIYIYNKYEYIIKIYIYPSLSLSPQYKLKGKHAAHYFALSQTRLALHVFTCTHGPSEKGWKGTSVHPSCTAAHLRQVHWVELKNASTACA